jgi:hypothetical protein
MSKIKGNQGKRANKPGKYLQQLLQEPPWGGGGYLGAKRMKVHDGCTHEDSIMSPTNTLKEGGRERGRMGI